MADQRRRVSAAPGRSARPTRRQPQARGGGPGGRAEAGSTPRSAVTPGVLAHVEALLARVLQFTGPADAAVSAYFRAHPKLGHRERGAVAEAVFAVLRRKSEFSHYAESGSGPATRRLAWLGLAAVFGVAACQGVADADEIAWLARVMAIDPAALAPRVRANLPEWIFAQLQARFGDDETQALAVALNRPAPLDCRVNVLKMGREAAMAALAAQGVPAEPTPYAPAGLRLDGKPRYSNWTFSNRACSKSRMKAASCCANCWHRGEAKWWSISARAPAARRWPWVR